MAAGVRLPRPTDNQLVSARRLTTGGWYRQPSLFLCGHWLWLPAPEPPAPPQPQQEAARAGGSFAERLAAR